MIPLKSSEGVARFPKLSLCWIGLLIALDVVSRVWPGPRADFLNLIAFYPSKTASWWHPSFLFHPSVLSLLVNLVFLWAFTPRLFERRSLPVVFMGGWVGAFFALLSFAFIHRYVDAPLIGPEALTGVWLGMFMRRDIWGSVETVVIGPGWVRVFSVPSYVLLFFWFFYLLLVNLFLYAPFSDAPMLYWLGFASFLFGFAWDSIFNTHVNLLPDDSHSNP